MASFYYNYQNPSGFCFLMLIRAIVFCSPLGLQNINLKRKTKWILVVVVKWCHHEKGLFEPTVWNYCQVLKFSLNNITTVASYIEYWPPGIFLFVFLVYTLTFSWKYFCTILDSRPSLFSVDLVSDFVPISVHYRMEWATYIRGC